MLVITHDDRYFHLADRIIRMENGQIAAIQVRSGGQCLSHEWRSALTLRPRVSADTGAEYSCVE